MLVDSPCAKAGGGGEDGERCNDGCHGDGLDERCQTCLFYPCGAAQLLDQFSLQGAADDFVSSAELCSQYCFQAGVGTDWQGQRKT